MSEKPLVSILCPTYNHEKYIERALQSFLAQKTNFHFEILVHDDASTDRTVKIIKEYQKKYPGIIKAVFRRKNSFSTGARGIVSRYLLPKALGKYTATCEGDDFWTDPGKLQRQVDFMEANPDHALCFHPVKVVHEDGKKEDYIFPHERDEKKFNIEELLKNNFIQTNSVMYRRQEYAGLNLEVMPVDWYLHLYHAQFGKIGFIDEVMSVYRRHDGGMWWDKEKVWKNHGLAHIDLYKELLKMYGDNSEYEKSITTNIQVAIMRILEFADEKTIRAVTEGYGEYLLKAFKTAIDERDQALAELPAKETLAKNLHAEQQAHELTRAHFSQVLDSRSFKIGRFLTRMVPDKIKTVVSTNKPKSPLKGRHNIKGKIR